MTEPPPPPAGPHGGGGEPNAIAMRAIEMSFGPVRANRGASLAVRAGEIHALVGENGAGKSTLMHILSGLYTPDAGSVEVLGRDVTGWSTADAITAGVGMVHQHFMLVPTLTVAENIVLGREPGSRGRLDTARAVREVEELSARTGLEVSARSLVSQLSVGEAQRVEIVKTLFRGARILILDEPTAVLSPPEVDELWTVLRRLREQGDTIVLITHKLDEVMELSDVVTVMRHGRTVEERIATRDTTPAAIARAMVGRDVALAAGAIAQAPRPGKGGAALEARKIVVATAQRPRAVDAVSFVVAPGEILGVAGVEGNGQTELVEAIAGLRQPSSGTVLVGGHDVTPLPPRGRAEHGLSHIPEDRHRRGLVLDYSVADNLILGRHHHFSPRGILDRAAIAAHAAERIEHFDVRPADPAAPVRALSGGNQQKVVIARELGRDFSVLLAAQPTRGVDVGAVEFIHSQLRAAREAGKAVLLVSAELSEVLALADRIAVMFRGRFVTVMPRAEASEEVLGPYMTGIGTGHAA